MDPAELLSVVPPLEKLVRFAPLTVWSVSLVALGWWARGRVDREFIGFLKEEIAWLKDTANNK